MPASSLQTYPEWKAPAREGELLIWPAAGEILQQTIENHRTLSSSESVRFQNVPLPELRRVMRKSLGHDDDRPLIATGHQTELHHPGVWIKNALIDAVARKLNGRAVHFSVDTDAPKHLQLRWPGFSRPITDDPSVTQAAWVGSLKPPTAAHLDSIINSLTEAERSWDFQPMLGQFLQSMKQQGGGTPNLAEVVAHALHGIDQDLGLEHQMMLTSPMWTSPAYLVFVYHLLCRAGEFARQYNDALKEYRLEHNIKSPGRPMPDLQNGMGNLPVSAGNAIESPFWLDHIHTGQRARLTVSCSGGLCLVDHGDALQLNRNLDGWTAAEQLGQWMQRHQVRLTPRVLTLTMFLRLIVSDQFVHGIGGGRYDQVLDRIITTHFGIAPPGFSVTTTTLYFPGAADRPRACLPCIRHEGHQLKHRILGNQKSTWIQKIESAPRGSVDRYQLFSHMHSLLRTAVRESGMLEQWQHRMQAAELQEQENSVLFDRELFYAIQPRERLKEMVEQYASRFA